MGKYYVRSMARELSVNVALTITAGRWTSVTKIDTIQELEGTHGVRTRVVLLYLPLSLTLTLKPETMSLLGYLKIISYTKFEHFRIIRC